MVKRRREMTMKGPRKSYRAEFKAKVAVEAIRGQKRTNEAYDQRSPALRAACATVDRVGSLCFDCLVC